MKQLVESVFAPLHLGSFKALLERPFTSTFQHASTDEITHQL